MTNKIYVCEEESTANVVGSSYHCIVVTASDLATAKDYVKAKIGIDKDPVWLMGATYPTIYVSDGSKPADIQAKILFNGNCHFYR